MSDSGVNPPQQLVCAICAEAWTRPTNRGPRPLRCPNCKKAHKKTYHHDYYRATRSGRPEADRRYQLRKKYGVTPEWVEAQVAERGCAICQTMTPTAHGWVVDHCHTTDRVRGVLCQLCNAGLGSFRDNPAHLERAISYLKAAT